MAKKVACTCTVHGCNKEPGGQYLVVPALLKKHQHDQHSADLLAMAADEQAAERARLEEVEQLKEVERMETAAKERTARQAEKERLRESKIEERAAAALREIARMEKEQEELLAQNHWTPESRPTARTQPRFAVDRKRISVGVLGSFLDLLEVYNAELELSKSPPDGLPLGLLHAGVHKLENLSFRSQNLKRDISLACRGKTFPEAKVLRSQASEGIKAQSEGIVQALEVWKSAIQKEMERRTTNDAPIYNTAHIYQSILPNSLAPVQVIIFMIVVCSTVLSFSRRGCSWLFRMSHAAVVEAFRLSPAPPTAQMDRVDSFPRDLQTAINHFNIDSKATTYAVCTNCHHLHPPILTDPLPVYPERCNQRRNNRGPKCTALLLRPRRVNNITRFVPIKPFVSFDFKDWMAKLMARPGNEKAMDGKWATLKPPVEDIASMTPEERLEYAADYGTETLLDIFDGSVVRNFKGPDGRHFSVPSKDGEGRYLFSLAFDAFNPLSNKQAGKKLSVGAFALICLNLPIEERYKPENMFLAGVIPGPKEPPLDEINSYWTPIVDCFLELWHTGVYFDRTYEHARGRLVRCAIVALICDILAARKIGGMASCMHEWFCTHCLCTRAVRRSAPNPNRRAKNRKKNRKRTKDAEDHFDESQLEAEMEMARNERGDSDGGESTHSESTETGPGNRVGYNNFAVNTWKARTNKSVRRWAEKYRTAPTQAEAQAHFNRSGVRWTEFLRLPYFDLPKMLVIDSMHNLFLGLLKEHFRNILGFRPTSSPPTPTPIDVLEINITPTALNPLPTKITELDSLRKALALLRQPMSAALKDPEESLKIPELPKFKQLHVASGVYIAKGLGLEKLEKKRNPKRPNVPVYISRKELVTKILAWRADRPEKQPPSPEPLADDAIPGVEPITQTEKEALWADLARMVKPSWVTSVPPHFGGESSDGKLKADQWRTLATLYMPVTLIRLWAASGVNTERRALLDLTMDLVSAIIVASSRTTSLSHYQECEEYLLAYRTKLSKLFPDYKCHPNHHFAMHIPAFLLLFGPVHGWWTYPLERLIGKLQRVPTNYKPGEYEKTIGQKFHRSANLTLMSTAPSFPHTLRELVGLFEKLIRPQTRNIFLDDELATLAPSLARAEARPLSPKIIAAFQGRPEQCPSSAVTPSFITYKGVRYTINSMHEGNSSIFVDDEEGKPIPFVIESIVQHETLPAAYLAVRRVKPVDVDDPFEQYPVLGAKIWSRRDDLEDNLEILLPSEVVGHFASCRTQVKDKSGDIIDAAVIVALRKSVVLHYGEQVDDEVEEIEGMDF